jgi:hypothetical protein
MLLKQVMPQAGKLDSPGTAVPVVVITEEVLETKVVVVALVDLDDEEVGVAEDVVFEVDVAEAKVVEEVVFIDVEVVEVEEEVILVEVEAVEEIVAEEVEMWEEVVVESDDEVEVLAAVVVKPSKAFAQTTAPLESAVIGTTVSPPVRSKVVISINWPPPMYEEQTAPAPGRIGSS